MHKRKRKRKKIRHPQYGQLTNHHLIPRCRIKSYYGTSFTLPRNYIKLWRFRHDAWHVLFENKTLNEVIRYLKKKKSRTYGYRGDAWSVLFRKKTWAEALALLKRARRAIRGHYKCLEFDPSLKRKVQKMLREHSDIAPVISHLNRRFKLPYQGPYLKVA
jgi:hypothetical protein